MMKTRVFLLPALLLLAVFMGRQPLPAENRLKDIAVQFNHLTSADGFDTDKINSITQDTKGFIWIGSYGGLFRYDGYTFKLYRHDPADSKSLGDTGVNRLYTDSAGRMWVGTVGKGLYLYEPETDGFTPCQPATGGPDGDIDHSIMAIHEDSEQNIWLGTLGDGAYIFDPRTNEFTHLTHDDGAGSGILNDDVLDIMEDTSKHIWIGTDNGLSRFDRAKNEWKHYLQNTGDSATSPTSMIRSITQDKQGNIWVGTYGGGLYSINPENDDIKRFTHGSDANSLSDNRIVEVYADSANKLWILSWDEVLNVFDPETGTFEHFSHNLFDKRSIGKGTGSAIFEDRAGSVWIGINGWGLSVSHNVQTRFAALVQDPINGKTLSNSFVRTILKDSKGNIWIGTKNGLNRIDPKTGTYTAFFRTPGDTGTLAGSSIYALFEDAKGLIWIGTFSGLSAYDPRTDKFRNYTSSLQDQNSLSHNFVHTITADSSGNLWIGTEDGLNRFDYASGRFERYFTEARFKHNGIYKVLADSTGNLYVGFVNIGLYRFDYRNKTWDGFKDNPVIGKGSVLSMTKDAKGRIWIGTLSGLIRFDTGSQTFERFAQPDGLPSDIIFGAVADDTGFIWLSTQVGLSRLDPDTMTFKNYGKADGLTNSGYEFFASYKDPNGDVWFGGKNGVDIVKNRDEIPNARIPPIRLTDIKIKNKSVQITDAVTLSWRDKVISFEFSALDYVNPKNNRYKYKLEGFDSDWIEADSTRRTVMYTNLDSGNYEFKVTGSNSDGLWNENGRSVSLHIKAPWWESPWFYFMCIAGTALLLTTVYLRKIRQLEKLNVLKNSLEKTIGLNEALLADKDLLLREVHHRIKNNMSTIKGLLTLQIAAEKNESSVASLKDAENRVQSIMMLYDRLYCTDNYRELPVREYLQPLAQNIVVAFSGSGKVQIETHIEDIILNVQELTPLGILANELLTNMMKHAFVGREHGLIILSVTEIPGALRMEIQDDGIGLPESVNFEQSTGFGMKLVGMLVEQISGTIRIERGDGTKFVLEFPLTAGG